MGIDNELSEMDQYALKNIRCRVNELISCGLFQEDDREDLRQHLFLEYWKRIGRFKHDRGTYKTFINRLIRNRAASLALKAIRLGIGRISSLSDDNESGGPIDASNDSSRAFAGLTAEAVEARLDVEKVLASPISPDGVCDTASCDRARCGWYAARSLADVRRISNRRRTQESQRAVVTLLLGNSRHAGRTSRMAAPPSNARSSRSKPNYSSEGPERIKPRLLLSRQKERSTENRPIGPPKKHTIRPPRRRVVLDRRVSRCLLGPVRNERYE